MKVLVNDFVFNVKKYFKYISKVGFKELFFDVLILFCMIVLAAFVYVPVGMLAELVRNFITSFTEMGNVGNNLLTWVFGVISALCAISLFMYLFNGRYDFKHDKVVPIEGSVRLERKQDKIEEKDKKEDKKTDEKKEYDLPKEKED